MPLLQNTCGDFFEESWLIMHMEEHSYRHTIAFSALLLLLPVRHLYQYLAVAGYFPFVGGAIAAVSVAIVSIITVPFFVKKRTLGKWLNTGLFLSFTFYVTLLILISPDKLDSWGNSGFILNLKILVYYWVFFLIGWNLTNLYEYKSVIFFFWSLMLINLGLHFNTTNFSIDLKGFPSDLHGIYLFLGDSFALWSLLTISVLRRPFSVVLIAVISTAALFAFQSRASWYAFILIFPLIMLFFRKSSRYFAIILVVLICFLALSGFIKTSTLQTLNSRMFAIKSLDSDNSVIARKYLAQKGLEKLSRHWFFGDYLGQTEYSNLGGYIHNYLSLWRQFGLIPFIVFLLFLGDFFTYGWILLRKIISRKKNISSENYFFLLGGLFSIIECIAARSYSNPFIWLFFGMRGIKSSLIITRKAKNIALHLTTTTTHTPETEVDAYERYHRKEPPVS